MSYRKSHIHPKIRKIGHKKLLQRPIFWLSALFLAVFCTILYFTFFFPGLYISQIAITGNQEVKAADIEGEVQEYLNRGLARSFFIANEGEIHQKLARKFPQLESITTKKDFPSQILISVKERQPFAVFCQDGDCFLMDSSGVIFKKVEHGTQNMILITSGPAETILGGNVIAKSKIDMIVGVQKNLMDSFQIEIEEVFVGNPMIFRTSENWKAYFGSEENIDLQITKINSLLEKEITEGERKNLQYIYLQYKDRAYYK